MDIKEHNNNQQLIDKSEINEIQIVSLILENAYKSFGQILLEFKYTLKTITYSFLWNVINIKFNFLTFVISY